MADKLEYIICAAIWYNDLIERVHLPINIKTGIVSCGYRHPNCFTTLAGLFPQKDYKGIVYIENKAENKCTQGFLTNKNRFIDRKEAAQLALNTGQVKELKFSNELYSEDLY